MKKEKLDNGTLIIIRIQYNIYKNTHEHVKLIVT